MGDTRAARPANDEDDVREDPFDDLLSAVFGPEEPVDLDDGRLDEILMEALAASVHIPERSRLRAISAAESVLFYEEETEEPSPSVRTKPTSRPLPAPPDSA